MEEKAYEKITPMNDDERDALHWWVSEGHSVHENWSGGFWEGGIPIDFLDVYRYEMEERAKLDTMTEDEKTEYLREMYGYGDSCENDITIEKLLMEDEQ